MKYLFIANKKIITNNAEGFKKYDIWEMEDGTFSYFEKVAFCPYCNHMNYLYNFFEAKDTTIRNFSEKQLIEVRYSSPLVVFKLKGISGYSSKEGFSNSDALERLVCRCPKCKTSLNTFKHQHITMSSNGYNNYVLKEYYIKPTDDRILISAVVNRVIPIVKKGKIIFQDIYIKIIINRTSGYTYLLEPRGKNNKRVSRYKGPQILNITYGNYGGCYKFIRPVIENDELLKELTKEVCLNKIANKSFLTVMLKNRFPMFDECGIEKLSTEISYGNISDKAMKILKRIKPEDITIRQMLKKQKTAESTETIRNVGNNNISIINYGILSSIGFKNQDVINNIIKLLFEENNILFCTTSNNELLKKMLVENGEALAGQKIINLIKGHEEDWNLIYESAENAYMLLRNNNIKIPHKALKGKFEKIERTLTNLYAENCSILENKKITYTEEEKQLEDVIDGIHFLLPKDTHSLFIIGQQLHICSAEYSSIAIEKQAIIIQMVRNNEIIGCIELKENNLIQAKAICNNVLQEKKAVALKKWVEKHNIHTDMCGDYEHIQNNKIEFDESKIYQNKIKYNIFAF